MIFYQHYNSLMTKRHTRYQAAIVRGDQILLLAHREHRTGRSYWVIPGGGIEPEEAEEACVVREAKEETGLDVTITRLLLDEAGLEGGIYARLKTYLCDAPNGEPAPGYEPEPEAAANYAISEVRWFDLRQPLDWDSTLRADPWTYPQLLRVREALGY